jgi:hypothetical protein
MEAVQTESDFERLSWHDCPIWGFAIRAGDPDEDDWTSDLVFDIDFILDWLCGVGGATQFRIAPATLVFHGVTDLKIKIDWGSSGFQVALHEVSIDRIQRELVRDQKVFLDRPYYSWSVRLNWPEAGEITFGAVGFTQTLRAAPVLTEKQRLSLRQRSQANR